MLPFLRPEVDSVSLIKPINPLKKNDIILYKRDNGAYVLHRIVGISDDGSFILCGDNQYIKEYGIHKESVIAIVNRVFRKEKEISFKSPTYRIYLLFLKSFKFRHVVVWLRRKIK